MVCLDCNSDPLVQNRAEKELLQIWKRLYFYQFLSFAQFIFTLGFLGLSSLGNRTSTRRFHCLSRCVCVRLSRRLLLSQNINCNFLGETSIPDFFPHRPCKEVLTRFPSENLTNHHKLHKILLKRSGSDLVCCPCTLHIYFGKLVVTCPVV